jgi:hypothetical protein
MTLNWRAMSDWQSEKLTPRGFKFWGRVLTPRF